MCEPDCLFCKIIAGEIPSDKVYEDETTYAFKDINPKAGNDPAQLAHMAQVAQSIADDAFHGAYRLIFNTGRDAGQSVFHVHAHVLTGETLDE